MKSIVFKTLDVRPFLARGEEPFAVIRAKVDGLEPDQGLTLICPFLPAPLIEMLKSEGFQSKAEHRSDGGWTASFWKE